MRGKTRLLLAPVVALALTVSACGGGGDTEVADTTDLDIAWNANPPTLDPLMSTATSTRDIARNVWEPLVAPDLDGQVQPVLAESYEVADDRSAVTFTLRSGVTFHDGAEMTADDVVASLERWITTSSLGAQYFDGATVEQVDEVTVTVHLPEPMYTALDLLADPSQIVAVMPRSVIESAPAEGITEYVGTGPYEMTEWADSQYVHLTKYEGYTSPTGESSGMAGEKTPVYENLYYRIVTDASTRMSGIQTGEYDIANVMNVDLYDQLESNPDIVTEIGENGFNAAVFNKKEGIMSERAMRQAVLSSLDMESIQTAAFANPDFYTLNGALMLPGQDPYFSEAGLEHFDAPDPDRVADLLDEAGYEGETVRILTSREYEDHYNSAVVVEQALNENGINATLNVFDWPTVLSTREDPSAYDIFVTGFSVVSVPTNYVFFGSEWPGWTEDEAIDRALDGITHASDEEEAAASSVELQEAFYDYLPAAKFGGRSVLTSYRSDITGWEFDRTAGLILYNVAPA